MKWRSPTASASRLARKVMDTLWNSSPRPLFLGDAASRQPGGGVVGRAGLVGAPRMGGRGLHLHAREVVVPLYKNRAAIRISAPVPTHMEAALRACGWTGDPSGPAD